MPIKPIYAEKLLSGNKRYEFRRAAIRSDLTHIIIYASSPLKKIIGIAEVGEVKVASPTVIWENTKHVAGISRRNYREYFHGKKQAHAIQINKVLALQNRIKPEDINNGFKVPQSFAYVDDAFFRKVLTKGFELRPANNIIFVGGIHGVGKTTICSKVCTKLDVQHLIASQLIKEYKTSNVRQDLDKSKRVPNIAENQDGLVLALQSFESNKPYLLDGHFTLLDAKWRVQKIPVSTFKKIMPNMLIVFVDEPMSIRDRIALRDGVQHDIQLLTTMQEKEIAHAIKVGKALGIDVYQVSPHDVNQLSTLISRTIKKTSNK